MGHLASRRIDRRKCGLRADWSLKAPIPYVAPLWQRVVVIGLVLAIIFFAGGFGR